MEMEFPILYFFLSLIFFRFPLELLICFSEQLPVVDEQLPKKWYSYDIVKEFLQLDLWWQQEPSYFGGSLLFARRDFILLSRASLCLLLGNKVILVDKGESEVGDKSSTYSLWARCSPDLGLSRIFLATGTPVC